MNDKKNNKEEDEIDAESAESKKTSGLLGEAAKRIFTAGVTAAFITEDSLRSYLSDIKLPKEILNVILQNASKSKDEIVQRAGREVEKLLQRVDVTREISKFATNHKFKIKAELEIEAKPEAGTNKGV